MAVFMLEMITYFNEYYYNMRYINVLSILKFYCQNLGSDSANKLSSATYFQCSVGQLQGTS